MDEIQDMALRLASPAELREMVQTLTRERDEARKHEEWAREDQSRQRDRPATIIDEAWGMQPCMPTDALLTELERRLHAGHRERARLRVALRLAEGPIAIAASYADQPCETMGMRVHAKDCARILPEIRAALAGEGEVEGDTTTIPFCACGRRVSECDGSRAGCGKTPEKARQA